MMKTRKTSTSVRTKRSAAKKIAIKTILVPVDFSKPSEKAMEYSMRLAEVFGSRIWLLHVIEGSAVATESLQWIDFYNQVRAVVLPMMENLASKIRKRTIPVKTDVVRGTAYLEILKLAKRHRVELIVIGSHGRTGMQHLIMGSVAERVVRMAPCPVLSIRP